MYGIFTNIGTKNHPNVGKYTIHGAYGYTLFKMNFNTDVQLIYHKLNSA